MGAIFNTQGTRTILHFLNVHYGPGPQFDQARANGEYNVLRDYATYPQSYGCADHLHLNDNSVHARWQQWLNLLDAYTQGGVPGGHLVRNMMADALDPGVDANCYGIEFFAVPAPAFAVHYQAPKATDPNNPNRWTREIVVETNTIDNMISAAKRRRKK
jgi:hypothetical protein